MIHRFTVTDSTNTQAKALAAAGAPHGTVVVADSQTGGKGRLGRTFHSPAGVGVYYSMILRPNCPPEQLMHLTCAAAVAACHAVESVSGIRPGVKWINDLVLGSKKLGGILTEISIDPATSLVEYAVVGIGINCNQLQSDFPEPIRDIATSLFAHTGKTVSTRSLEDQLTNELLRIGSALLEQRSAIMEQYRKDCITVGQPIVAIRGEEKRYGTATGVLDDGSLQILLENGQQETVNSGEVSIRGMYGYI